MSDSSKKSEPSPKLNFTHGVNGVHISPDSNRKIAIDFDRGELATEIITPESVAAEKAEKAHKELHEQYPFLDGIPIEIQMTWNEQWRNASATEGGRRMDMWEFIAKWVEQDSSDVVPDVFPRRETIMIAAESGGGKSYLGAEMFKTCLTGGKWWGRYPAPKLTPLYCLIEDQKGWSKRLMAHLNTCEWKPGDTMGYIRNDLPRLIESGSFNRNKAGGYEWYLRIRADQYRGTLPEQLDVLFVDYLRDAAPGADEQSNNDMSLVMDGLNQLARALNLLIVVMHHRGANTDKATRGATVVVDKSYAVFVLTGKLATDDKDAKVKIEAAKSPKGIARPTPIYFRLNGESGNVPVVNYVASGDSDLADEIYKFLRTYPDERFSISQLRTELDQPDDANDDAWEKKVDRAAKAMRENEVKYPGIHYLPGKGRGKGYAFSMNAAKTD